MLPDNARSKAIIRIDGDKIEIVQAGDTIGTSEAIVHSVHADSTVIEHNGQFITLLVEQHEGPIEPDQDVKAQVFEKSQVKTETPMFETPVDLLDESGIELGLVLKGVILLPDNASSKAIIRMEGGESDIIVQVGDTIGTSENVVHSVYKDSAVIEHLGRFKRLLVEQYEGSVDYARDIAQARAEHKMQLIKESNRRRQRFRDMIKRHQQERDLFRDNQAGKQFIEMIKRHKKERYEMQHEQVEITQEIRRRQLVFEESLKEQYGDDYEKR